MLLAQVTGANNQQLRMYLLGTQIGFDKVNTQLLSLKRSHFL
jgi:hypothetical protein